MKTNKIIDAVKDRYGDMHTLRLGMFECEDSVMLNIAQDTNIEEDTVLTTLKNLLKHY